MSSSTRQPSWRWAPLCALAAALPAAAITHTGNPGTAVVLTAPSGWTLSGLQSATATVAVQSCATGAWTSLVATPTTAPSFASFDPVPAGTWCGLQAEVIGIDLIAEDSAGRRIEIDGADVVFTQVFIDPVGVQSGDDPWNIELGTSWLDLAAAYLDPGEHKLVAAGSVAMDAIEASLSDATIWVDSDADAVTSSSEMGATPIGQ